MSKLLRIATDPALYDSAQVDWAEEGKGLQSSNRAHYWSYINHYVHNWTHRSVIDIGAGTGWLPDVLLREVPVGLVVGIEPSKKNVDLARKLYPNVEMIRTTLQNYFSDSRFDLAVAVMSLLHIHPLSGAMEKISSLLTPKGELVAIVPDYDYFKMTRKGRMPTIEILDHDEYVAAIKREYGTVADIVRKIDKYKQEGASFNLTLMNDIPMPLSPEELIRYPELSDVTVTHLLHFRKNVPELSSRS